MWGGGRSGGLGFGRGEDVGGLGGKEWVIVVG